MDISKNIYTFSGSSITLLLGLLMPDSIPDFIKAFINYGISFFCLMFFSALLLTVKDIFSSKIIIKPKKYEMLFGGIEHFNCFEFEMGQSPFIFEIQSNLEGNLKNLKIDFEILNYDFKGLIKEAKIIFPKIERSKNTDEYYLTTSIKDGGESWISIANKTKSHLLMDSLEGLKTIEMPKSLQSSLYFYMMVRSRVKHDKSHGQIIKEIKEIDFSDKSEVRSLTQKQINASILKLPDIKIEISYKGHLRPEKIIVKSMFQILGHSSYVTNLDKAESFVSDFQGKVCFQNTNNPEDGSYNMLRHYL